MQVALISTDEPAAAQDFLAALGKRVTVRALRAPSAPVASGSHRLADALRGFESMLIAERPDAVLVDGDGSAAFAAALAAVKLELPVGRLGAGCELASEPVSGAVPDPASGYGRLADRLGAALFCNGETELVALRRAGLGDHAVVVGADRERSVAAIAARLDEL